MKYPVTPVRPVNVTFGSVSLDDPFHWLEEESLEGNAWQAEQDALTQGYLQGLPAYSRLMARLKKNPRVTSEFPTLAGGRWFRVSTPEGKDLKAIEVGETQEGPWRTVVDLNAFDMGEPLSLDVMAPSPDGKKLLYIWSRGGREVENPCILDVDTGSLILAGIRQVRSMFHAWTPDSSALYYSAYDPAVSMTHCNVYKQVIGAELTTSHEACEATHPVVWARPAADKRHVLITADHLCPRPDYIKDEQGDGQWRPFLKGATHLFKGDIIGSNYIAITDEGAACGRLVSIPLSTPQDRSTWKELVPGSDNVLASILVVGDRIVLVDLVDTFSRIRVLKDDGTIEGEIRGPGPGAASTYNHSLFNMVDMLTHGPDGEVFFPWSSPSSSPALCRADVRTREAQVVFEPQIKVEAKYSLHRCRSADGAEVLYHVISRPGVDLSKPQPALMHGYGAFNVAVIPGWAGVHIATWIESGGVFVLAHLRGGGERGPQQWHTGRLQFKQNGFNDAFAIAEDLIAKGISTGKQIGFIGGSNGGTVAAGLAVQRPDLFGACAAIVPVTDPLARIRNPITMAATLDFGDPNDPEMSRVLYAWSPYHGVRDGVAYSALFTESGENDPRCPTWHGRKITARVQTATSGQAPVLLRVRAGAGHGAVGVAAQRAQHCDWLTFLAENLGLQIE